MVKLRFWSSVPGNGSELCAKQPEEFSLWQVRVYWEEAWACQRRNAPLLGGAWGKRQDHCKIFFPCESYQTAGHSLRESEGRAGVASASIGSTSCLFQACRQIPGPTPAKLERLRHLLKLEILPADHRTHTRWPRRAWRNPVTSNSTKGPRTCTCWTRRAQIASSTGNSANRPQALPLLSKEGTDSFHD